MQMGRFGSSRFSRVEAVHEASSPSSSNENNERIIDYQDNKNKTHKPSSRKIATAKKIGKTLKAKVLSRVFSEDYARTKNKILDPRGQTLQQWNKTFLVACLFSLFLDPMFFYLPIIRPEYCIDIAVTLRTILTIIRSVADVFYVIQIFVKFHTAYIAPSSRVVGRGELVIDTSKIAVRYLRNGFFIDLLTVLPLPQVLVWTIMPNIDGYATIHSINVVWFIIIVQWLARLCLVFPLSSQIVEATGVVTKTAWQAAGYNYLIFFLSGNVFGAIWYILSIQRQEDCWHWLCGNEMSSDCPNGFFDCRNVDDLNRVNWFQSSNISYQCNPNNNLFPFGIMGDAVRYSVQESRFLRKYFYCLWWGLKNMSTLGQSFTTSTFVGENVFACIITTVGLVLLALLIGNVQRYLQSTMNRLEEWKIQRADTEKWMRRRELPQGLRLSVRKYDEYKWLTAKGVDEEALINGLPLDLRRKIRRHLCFDLLKRVPLINEMDETMLDTICERLRPALCNKGRFLVREGDPVNQMHFIIRGCLDSYSTNGTHSRIFNFYRIGPGDFCGEELLTWALNPNPGLNLPSSTRSVKAVDEVEAFALVAEDLRFVATQFRRLNSKKMKNKLRFYSNQWRTWAACTIQAAWRRHKRLKEVPDTNELGIPQSGSFWSRYAEIVVANVKNRQLGESHSRPESCLKKPDEPDFSEKDR